MPNAHFRFSGAMVGPMLNFVAVQQDYGAPIILRKRYDDAGLVVI